MPITSDKDPVTLLRRKYGRGGTRVLFAPVFRRTPAKASREGVGEDEGIGVAHRLRHGFDLEVRRFQQLRRASHAHVGDMMHRAPTQLPPAQPSQVPMTVAGLVRKTRQVPALLMKRPVSEPENA